MSEEFDGPWKEAAQDDFPWVLEFFFPQVYRLIDWTRDHESLDAEFHKLLPEAEAGAVRVDRLVRTMRRDGDDALFIHLEIQMNADPGFSARMYDYRTKIRARFGLPPESLAILGDDNEQWRPEEYVESQVQSEMRFRFGVAKVVEWADRREELEAGTNPFGLFVAAHLETLATRKNDVARLEAKRRILGRLSDLGGNPIEAHRWYQLMDWLMKLPAETNLALWQELRERKGVDMRYVTGAELYGRQKGLIEGKQEGLIEGQQVGRVLGQIEGERITLLQNITKLLTARFGAEETQRLTADLNVETPERLRRLFDEALVASLEDIRRAIQGPT